MAGTQFLSKTPKSSLSNKGKHLGKRVGGIPGTGRESLKFPTTTGIPPFSQIGFPLRHFVYLTQRLAGLLRRGGDWRAIFFFLLSLETTAIAENQKIFPPTFELQLATPKGSHHTHFDPSTLLGDPALANSHT